MDIIVVSDRIKSTYPKPIFSCGDEGSLCDTYISTIGGTLCQYWTRHIIANIRMWVLVYYSLIDGGPST